MTFRRQLLCGRCAPHGLGVNARGRSSTCGAGGTRPLAARGAARGARRWAGTWQLHSRPVPPQQASPPRRSTTTSCPAPQRWHSPHLRVDTEVGGLVVGGGQYAVRPLVKGGAGGAGVSGELIPGVLTRPTKRPSRNGGRSAPTTTV